MPRAGSLRPRPVPDFGHVLAVLADVVAVLDEFVAHLLFEIVAGSAELRQAVDDVLHEVETVQAVCTRMSKAVVIVPSSL